MRGIHTCCPEAPGTINIYKTELKIDSGEARYVDKTYTGSQFSGNNAIVLDYAPFSKESTFLFLNSGSQIPGTDFSVQGKILTLNFAPNADDVIHVKYMARIDGLTWSDYPVGALIGLEGAVIPNGWFLMAPATEVYEANYPNLFAYLSANLGLVNEEAVPDPGDPFTLKALSTSYFDPNINQLVQGQTIIKHD